MSNKDVIENLEFCLYKGRCTECSLGEEKSMLSCRTLLEDCRTALKNSVEVVRCKDCKYSTKDKYHAVSVVCTRFKTGQFTHRMQPMNFCSYGEMKEE